MRQAACCFIANHFSTASTQDLFEANIVAEPEQTLCQECHEEVELASNDMGLWQKDLSQDEIGFEREWHKSANPCSSDL